jgi:hypothetical protein
MRNDEEGILAGIKIIDANLRCKFAMQMFDPYSSMNSLWTAVVVKFQTAQGLVVEGKRRAGQWAGLLSWNCQLELAVMELPPT